MDPAIHRDLLGADPVPSGADGTSAASGEPSASHARAYAAGVRDEDVLRIALPSFLPWPTDAGSFGDKVESVAEELETEVETFWQMGALAFATVQRIAHGQEEILTAMLTAMARPPTDAPPTSEQPPLSESPPGLGFIVVSHLFRGLEEIVAVVGEAHRELSDIHIERLAIWSSTLQRLFGRG